MNADNVLDVLLEDRLTLATSTPGADPAGDYTWEAFGKAEAIRPGARARLISKAKMLFGGRDSPPVPAGRDLADFLLTSGAADLLIAYCSGEVATKKANAAIGVVPFPASLRADAVYGIAVNANAPVAAFDYALFHLSTRGQATFRDFGFVSP